MTRRTIRRCRFQPRGGGNGADARALEDIGACYGVGADGWPSRSAFRRHVVETVNAAAERELDERCQSPRSGTGPASNGSSAGGA